MFVERRWVVNEMEMRLRPKGVSKRSEVCMLGVCLATEK